MKSVGEVMAIGRTFKESLFKGLRSLEAVKPLRLEDIPDHVLQRKLSRPNSQRFSYITYALQHGYTIEEVHRLTKIDPWFLEQLVDVMRLQDRIEDRKLTDVPTEILRTAKEFALSDRRIAFLPIQLKKKFAQDARI
jgi:carbamoyl-phosphate synthase large subunit